MLTKELKWHVKGSPNGSTFIIYEASDKKRQLDFSIRQEKTSTGHKYDLVINDTTIKRSFCKNIIEAQKHLQQMYEEIIKLPLVWDQSINLDEQTWKPKFYQPRGEFISLNNMLIYQARKNAAFSLILYPNTAKEMQEIYQFNTLEEAKDKASNYYKEWMNE